MEGEVAEKGYCGDVVIDISESDSEILCRICLDSGGELIQLGCDCKGEIGLSHYHCAARWFSRKRNRECEICGKTAINISDGDVAQVAAVPAPYFAIGVFVCLFIYVLVYMFFAYSRKSEEDDKNLNLSRLFPLVWRG